MEDRLLIEGKENVILENLPDSGYKIENKPAKENGQLEWWKNEKEREKVRMRKRAIRL